MKNPYKIALVVLISICWLSPELWAEPRNMRIGVFGVHQAGGDGADCQGLVKGLRESGYQVDIFTNMKPLSLARFDLVYLSDMQRPGRVHENWRKDLQRYVKSGGSVLQTWHHHLSLGVGSGVKRIFDSRRMAVVPGHPAIDGIADFNATFKDHIIEKVGPSGTPLLKNDAGDIVAAAGKLGRGKVISTGLALAMPNGRSSQPPKGNDLKLLQAFLKWLEPEVTQKQRLSAFLQKPELEISVDSLSTVAGFPTTFTVTAAFPGGKSVTVECPDAEVNASPADTKMPEWVRSFVISVPTARTAKVEKTLTILARSGDQRKEGKVLLNIINQTPPEKEMRGVWLHVGNDRHPTKVMPELKRLGLNTAMLRIAGGTAAFFASKVQPDIQDPLAPDGDWLEVASREARANGISLHPYVNNCVVEGRTSEKTLAKLRDAGRLQVGRNGRIINWFCPSQEVNLTAMEAIMLEIATRYDVDGVQYDFIRYNNSDGCYDDYCRALFEKETGHKVANWPEDLNKPPLVDEWTEFRCRRISAIVERISTKIRQQAPKIKISAAVFRDWPDCRKAVGQDWVRWCKEGWLDFVCPMNYTLNDELFAKRTEIHRDALPAGFPVAQGIGIASGRGTMTAPAQVALQISLARKFGAIGFVGFAYKPKHTATLFQPLEEWLGE